MHKIRKLDNFMHDGLISLTFQTNFYLLIYLMKI